MTKESIFEDIEILVSLKKLIKYDLTISDYMFIYMIDLQERWKLSVYNAGYRHKPSEELKRLVEMDYLKQIANNNLGYTVANLQSTQKAKDMLLNNTDKNVEDWIDEWYDLWPKGVKTGGYYLRSDRFGALSKMKTFMVRYPIYSKDKIMLATKNYLNEQSIDGYKYTKLAPYFISKNGLSILAGECEALDDNMHNTPLVSFGQDEL